MIKKCHSAVHSVIVQWQPDKLEARGAAASSELQERVALGHVQAKDTEDAQRSAQKAIADMPVRSEVKLVTCAQPSEAGS